ncbi:MAG TPA: hypothetical protein VIG24_19200, partial [Acidimicrobiia bacterium]
KQAVMLFADAAARTTALSGNLREGMVSYNLAEGRLEVYDGSDWAAIQAQGAGDPLVKADQYSPVINVTGAGAAEIKAGTVALVEGAEIAFGTATAITMPSLSAGTDYYVYVGTDGSAEAVAAMGSWPSPVAAPPADSALIGGFHYAPGGNATGFDSGGDATPAINEFSCWDLKWRPSCPDPRGMTCVNGSFWSDIYLTNRDPDTNGTSRNSEDIADGATGGTTTPIIPAAFGGNGTNRYSSYNWWNASEVMAAYGKRLPGFREFAALAWGVQEAQSRGNDPVTTGLSTSNSGSSNADETFTSFWGVIQASGVLYTWGDHFGGGAAGASWSANTEGRGSSYQLSNAVRFGGDWLNGADSGSRCSRWSTSPTGSPSDLSSRGVCDHLRLA